MRGHPLKTRRFPNTATLFRRKSSVCHPIRAPERARAERHPSPVKNQSGSSPQAARNRSTRLAAARGGGCAASPRWVRVRAMAAGSSIAAMSFSCPPQCGQRSISMSNTRLSNCAQRMRAFALPAGVWAQSPACAGAVGVVGSGTTVFRSFAFGASTP